MVRTKMTKLRNGSKGSIRTRLSLLRVRHFITELQCSTNKTYTSSCPLPPDIMVHGCESFCEGFITGHFVIWWVRVNIRFTVSVRARVVAGFSLWLVLWMA